MIPRATGQEVERSDVAQIRLGETTKDDLFTAFGVPAAIVRPESTSVKVPSASMVMPISSGGSGMTANRAGGYYIVQPIVFLETLGLDSLAENQRLYLFSHAWFMGYALIGLGVYETSGTSVDELVVLVDEETETVQQYFYFED